MLKQVTAVFLLAGILGSAANGIADPSARLMSRGLSGDATLDAVARGKMTQSRGAFGPAVRAVQQALATVAGTASADVASALGVATAKALAAFQRGKGLAPSGMLDALTLLALDRALAPLEGPAPPPPAPPTTSPSRLIHTTQTNYFDRLDRDPVRFAKSRVDPVGALEDFVVRTDVPQGLDNDYAATAGSRGGGRLLLVLDYTRGFAGNEPFLTALKQGLGHALVNKVIGPLLAHFRTIGANLSLFRGDVGMTAAFRDSHLWGPDTNQIGHLLCAMDIGARLARLGRHPLEKAALDAALWVAVKVLRLDGVMANLLDWARMVLIGHEMMDDETPAGFVGQMRAYGRLVSNGDPAGIRAHFDAGVAAIRRGDDAEAWTRIRAIARAAAIPGTAAEMTAAIENPRPRFATPHASRDGNSLADLALSMYGFATGMDAMQGKFPTPEALRAHLDSLYRGGARAAAINRAAGF
jgi:hypothetical protein